MATGPSHPESTPSSRGPIDPNPGADVSLPAALGDDLQALFGVAPEVPTAIDLAILDDARQNLARRPRVLFTFRRISAALATAAVLTLVAYIAIPQRQTSPRPIDGREVAMNRSASAPAKESTDRDAAGRTPATSPALPAMRTDDSLSGRPDGATPRPESARRALGGGLGKATRDPVVAFKQGQATIVDALVLAQIIRDSRSVALVFDVNGDGAVDQRDVDAIARQSVNLAAHPAPVDRPRGGPG